MLNKIRRPLTAICLVAVIGLLTCGIVNAKANPTSLQLIGKNNTEVTLFADKHPPIQSDSVADNEDSNLEIGQVIVSNGVKEIIFALGTDGSYITIPVSD
ncbi:hypothetical protein BXY41_101343 [Lacrimispora xylanisolvens]|jgi:hypothetical protein|uniref:Pilus formation protein N-terminal domain-containing protein n=1 Tax=Lacrimispora xylanisolvens TaxID=384636 RepID=A0A2S6HYX8_9FIRM|nr:hypothetical protein [Hungatella xylanolytica]MBE5986272.1 hypothetical protein [Paenibacillaceae bacterium]PPK83280.1 hypothetical protein BXY41_101343 [Hungatella xylanolytica]